MNARHVLVYAFSSIGLVTGTAWAEGTPPAAPPTEPAADAAPAADAMPADEREAAIAGFMQEIGAITGPATASAVGSEAQIDVPAGYWFVPRSGTAAFDEATENLHDPGSVGVLASADLESVVYFSFRDIGYVNDDERDLDADELLEQMREIEASANVERRARGFSELELVGWAKEPFYNEATQSLEWATILKTPGETGPGTVNYNTRRLGRGGVMEVLLVTEPDHLQGALATMNAHMSGFAFVPGRDYASYSEGDRIAEIGLGALVVGGGLGVAAKLGFFKKFWKLLVGGGVVLVAALAKLFGRRRKDLAAVDGGGAAGAEG